MKKLLPLIFLAAPGCQTVGPKIDVAATFPTIVAYSENPQVKSNKKIIVNSGFHVVGVDLGVKGGPDSVAWINKSACGGGLQLGGTWSHTYSRHVPAVENELLGLAFAPTDQNKKIIKIKSCIDWPSYHITQTGCGSASVDYQYFVVYERYIDGLDRLRSSDSCAGYDPLSGPESVLLYASPRMTATGRASDAQVTSNPDGVLNDAEVGMLSTWGVFKGVGVGISSDPDLGKAISDFSLVMHGEKSPVEPASKNHIATSLEKAKKTCVELGFEPRTERFGKCVLKLSR